MAEIGQQCSHGLVAVGRHRVCRECATVYAAVDGPPEVTLLGGYTGVRALLDEALAALSAAQRPEQAGSSEAESLRALLKRAAGYLDYMENRGYSSQRMLSCEIAEALAQPPADTGAAGEAERLRAGLQKAIRSHENLLELRIIPDRYRDECRQIIADLQEALAPTPPQDGPDERPR